MPPAINNNSSNSSHGSRLALLWQQLSAVPPAGVKELLKEHTMVRGELEALGLASNDDKPGRRGRNTDRLNCLPAFLAWCEREGIDRADLLVRPSPNGLCLVSTRARSEGDIVASVPHQAMLCVDQAGQIDSLQRILDGDDMLRAMDNVALAMCVAHEALRGEESRWAPYIDCLPATFQTPIFYAEEQLQALKPSPVFEEALGMYRSIARQFVYFYLRILGDVGEKGKKHLNDANTPHPFLGSPFTPHNFTFDFYRWCVGIVSTRINIVPSRSRVDAQGNAKMIPALIPLIDLANHAHVGDRPGSVYFNPETDSVKLQLNTCLEAGQEVCIYYGKRTNGKFLLHNGFVPAEANPDDVYDLKLGLPSSSPLAAAKLDLLHRRGILPSIPEHPNSSIFHFPLSPGPTALSLRQSELWEFALAFVATSKADLTAQSLRHSEEIEQKAAKFLADRFALLIRGYGHAEEEKEDDDDVKQAIGRLKARERALLADYAEVCLGECRK